MEREVKLVSAWEGRAHKNSFKLMEEEVEKQLGESDKYEIKPISESLKEKVVEFVKLQEVLLEVFQKKVL